MTRKEVDELSMAVLRTLDDLPVDALFVLAHGLRQARNVWGGVIFHAAHDREAGEEYGLPARLCMGIRLRELARDDDARSSASRDRRSGWPQPRQPTRLPYAACSSPSGETAL